MERVGKVSNAALGCERDSDGGGRAGGRVLRGDMPQGADTWPCHEMSVAVCLVLLMVPACLFVYHQSASTHGHTHTKKVSVTAHRE